MARALFSLMLIPLGLALGWVLRAVLAPRPGRPGLDAKWFSLQKLPLLLQRIAILGFNPIAIVTSIWALCLGASGVATLPFIGLGVMAFGLLTGLAAMKIFRMGKDSGTVFSLSSSLTNLGSIGSLVAFLILGEQAFALVPFYKLFEEAWIYGLCFPLAAGVQAQKAASIHVKKAAGAQQQAERSLGTRGAALMFASLLKDPMILLSLAAMGLGLALNVSGISRPQFFRTLNAWIVPSGVFLVLVSIGMKIPKDRKRIPRHARPDRLQGRDPSLVHADSLREPHSSHRLQAGFRPLVQPLARLQPNACGHAAPALDAAALRRGSLSGRGRDSG